MSGRIGQQQTRFLANPVQKQFIESRARADLFSSRMGEGKSAALAWAIYYHTFHNPGACWALCRDTFENLIATTQKEFFKWFKPGVYGTYHAQKKTFTWAEGVGKGEVTFLGMDDPVDAGKLMSRELAGIAMDEPAPAQGSAGIDEMVFDMGLTRLRQPGMGWYSMKLAENNPDETHWTWKKFVGNPQPGFRIWQPATPENNKNLPVGYYETIRKDLAHRPDLVRRFVEGEFGFQIEGKQVTPQWNDRLHLATGLIPIPRYPLILCWDFGHNPTCVITQITPLGHWQHLDAMVGDGIGVEELIDQAVKPLLLSPRYGLRVGSRNNPDMLHIGDPSGTTGEQTSIRRTPVRMIKRDLGGQWRSGPQKTPERLEPLRSVLTKTVGGRGLVLVDRDRAAPVWQALRGGWHFHVSRGGIISGEAKKNMHSHPGDAVAYAAAILYPLGRLRQRPGSGMYTESQTPSYFGRGGKELVHPGVPTNWPSQVPRG